MAAWITHGTAAFSAPDNCWLSCQLQHPGNRSGPVTGLPSIIIYLLLKKEQKLLYSSTNQWEKNIYGGSRPANSGNTLSSSNGHHESFQDCYLVPSHISIISI